jgi:signal transduction histidine kinase
MFKKILFILVYICLSFSLYGSSYPYNLEKKGFTTLYYFDEIGKEKTEDVLRKKFFKKRPDIFPNGLKKSIYWIKLIANKSSYNDDVLLSIDQSRLTYVKLHLINNNKIIPTKFIPFVESKRKIDQGKTFNLPKKLKKGEAILIEIKAKEIFSGSVKIYKKDEFVDILTSKSIFFGIYTGIMLIMIVYNFFLFIIIKDKSYIFYILYILFIWLTQISIQGYSNTYFWSENSSFDDYSIIILSNLALIFASLFTKSFLNTRLFSKISDKIFNILIFLAVLNMLIPYAINIQVGFQVMQAITIFGCFLALSSAYFVYFEKHFKPAGYYLVAWSILIVGAVLFVMKDYGILPYNNFTIYLLQISSVVEVMLLSFALADRINFFKKENELAQKRALDESIRNEQLVKQQNIYLEKNVKKRTQQLEKANNALNTTLNDLKNAQSHLVDSEKMAALGQLTAGIAHEINNPINFVTSNIKPLELDINDLKEVIHKYEQINYSENIPEQLAKIEAFKKQIDINFVNKEISSLLEGISEGARRTAEIIKSLKSFSRIDESDMKPVDLNEGIKSTLILLKNGLPDNLQVTTIYENIPSVECLPGKINQVFMNLISNAVQAIKSKRVQNQTEYLTIKTSFEKEKVKISIKDTGIGMTEETKHRIFEPFFTTKDIGEGTGLGLSIVFGIIEKHKGHIDVISTLGEGTEFIITLNINQSNK